MLRKIFGAEREEVNRESRGLYIEESYDFYPCGILKLQIMLKLHFFARTETHFLSRN